MQNVIAKGAAFVVGASAAATFSMSALDLDMLVFIVALAALGMLASLTLGKHAGVAAGFGVISAFTGIGIMNGIERGADITVYFSMPLILAIVFLLVVSGSLIGDGLRSLVSAVFGRRPKA